MAQATAITKAGSGFYYYTRSGGNEPEQPFEKMVVLPTAENQDPAAHAWAEGRFVTEIMAEHALFFALLMPPEVAGAERDEALLFNEIFTKLYHQIGANQPDRSALKIFAGKVTEAIKPFIEYKERMSEAQKSGNLRSLVWPLFFDHTRHEAERWTRRLNSLGQGEAQLDLAEVVTFWTNIMDQHARFVYSIGIPKDSVIEYETQIKTGKFVVIAHGSPTEVSHAQTALAETKHNGVQAHACCV